jgi:hypothetical protein
MTPNRSLPWWLRKRVWLPLLFLLGLAGAFAVAIARSNTSKIILYNETGTAISALKITACGQETVFRNVAEEESFRWKLAQTGAPGEIAIETASDPAWRWRGGFIEPHGGYRVTLRLWPNGEVDLQTQISIWQRFLHAAPKSDN